MVPTLLALDALAEACVWQRVKYPFVCELLRAELQA